MLGCLLAGDSGFAEVCRRFAIQQQLVAMQHQKVMDDALEILQSVLKTFKPPGCSFGLKEMVGVKLKDCWTHV